MTTLLPAFRGRMSVQERLFGSEQIRRVMANGSYENIVDAFRVASYNPTHAVGVTDRGEIRAGLKADLILVNQKMNVSTVILNGKVRY